MDILKKAEMDGLAGAEPEILEKLDRNLANGERTWNLWPCPSNTRQKEDLPAIPKWQVRNSLGI